MGKRKRYVDHLHEILSDDAPAPASTRSRAEIQADIDAISEMLRGPLHNAERLNLVEDRHHLRKQLSAMPPAHSSTPPQRSQGDA